MRVPVLAVALVAVAIPVSSAAQPRTDRVAEAYAQFVLGHHLDEADDQTGAIAAYKRAMELDPNAADIPAELAALYLRENKIQEALVTAEQALKLDSSNREANRVVGIVYAALVETGRPSVSNRGRPAPANDENLTKAIRHLETSIAGLGGEADPQARATLARAYVANSQFDKAIPLLGNLVLELPGWPDGPLLLAEAYAASGRNGDAIAWLEEHADEDSRLLPTLADFYERERRWKDAAAAYARAIQRSPRANADLRARYASALVNAGGRDNLTKARDVLTELTGLATGPNAAGGAMQRLLYLRSQTERRLGDSKAAEASARRIIAQNAKSPWGYYALAEALESRQDYAGIISEISPVIAQFRGASDDAANDLGLLLPHLGFAYQQTGQYDKAIATFEEAHRVQPKDSSIAAFLAEANIAAKKYAAAVEVSKAALADNPDDARLTRVYAQALRHVGRVDQGATLLEDSAKKRADDPGAQIALAQFYSDAERGPQALTVLQTAQTRFPDNISIAFELGATYDKMKRFADAESAFKKVIALDPQNAAALNYLGYMLAERGERLDESVDYVKKALALDPDNGSYLDSLGWAYYKADKLELAENSLKRAADQLRTNSVIQDHYGDVLLKLGRYDEAIAAFDRALKGDGDSVDRAGIDRKIRTAKQKIKK